MVSVKWLPFCLGLSVLTFQKISQGLISIPNFRISYRKISHSVKKLRSIDQSHRYGRHQAACREPAGSYDRLLELLYVLNIKRNIF